MRLKLNNLFKSKDAEARAMSIVLAQCAYGNDGVNWFTLECEGYNQMPKLPAHLDINYCLTREGYE